MTTMTKRCVYIGNFSKPWCTEVHIAGSLQSLGWQVDRVQEDRAHLGYVAKLAHGTDLLLYTRTWGLPDKPAWIDLWRSLEAIGVVTASYHLDLYVGLARQATLEGDPFWATGFVFTPDGSAEAATFFEEHGINHRWMRPGVYHAEAVPGQFKAKLATDVVFVGSYPYPHPEWPWRDTLVSWLAKNYAGRFAHYGVGGRAIIRGKQLNDLYASATVVVGDSVDLRGYYWSDRIYETIGRGGFLIHPWIEGIGEEFSDGHHCRFYDRGSFADIREIIDHYLAHPDEARRIANDGQEMVANRCTYRHRLTEALEQMGLGE